MAADRQLVSRPQPAFEDPDAVDADAVGAAQVADDEVVADLGETAMAEGDLAGFDLEVALGVPAEQQNGLIHQDAGSFRQSDQLRRHSQPTEMPKTAGPGRSIRDSITWRPAEQYWTGQILTARQGTTDHTDKSDNGKTGCGQQGNLRGNVVVGSLIRSIRVILD